MKEIYTDVLIIGAGPTGLMAAAQLARFGIDFTIIDKKEGPTPESRAIAVTTRSLEIYEQMDLAKTALKEGAFIKVFCLYADGKERANIPIGEIGKGQTDFPYLFAFEQSKNEELLYGFIKEKGKEVLWNTEFKSLSANETEVKAISENILTRENIHITARYVIACDGAKSPVRHLLNFSFEGGTYENKFFVADTKIEWGIEGEKILAAPTRNNFALFFPMHGEKHYRVLGSMPKEFQEIENITFRHLEELIKKTINVPMTFTEVSWFSIYNLHHRAVETFKKGKIFLAGDSAHIHSPAGGQGMNTGLQDAYNLAWKLAYVIKGISGEKLLETYNEERLPFAKLLLKFTDRAFGVMTSTNLIKAIFRKYLFPPLFNNALKIKRLRKKIFRTISQIAYSYSENSISEYRSSQKLKFKAGDRFPYILNEDGTSYYSLMKEPRFFLVKLGTSAIPEELNKFLEKKNSFIKIINGPISKGWKKTGVLDDIYILVRPDMYIALISDTLTVTELRNYLLNNLFIP